MDVRVMAFRDEVEKITSSSIVVQGHDRPASTTTTVTGGSSHLTVARDQESRPTL
ncbi:hypothetical protein J6590_053422 [Homalodisca vitripennis]|nr:hypothetical protein J6590_053422 [Homalodisca vitripennis]